MKTTFILIGKSILLIISFFILEELLGYIMPYIFSILPIDRLLGGLFQYLPELVVQLIVATAILLLIELYLIGEFIDEQYKKTRIALYSIIALRIIVAVLFLIYSIYHGYI